MNAQDDFYFL